MGFAFLSLQLRASPIDIPDDDLLVTHCEFCVEQFLNTSLANFQEGGVLGEAKV